MDGLKGISREVTWYIWPKSPEIELVLALNLALTLLAIMCRCSSLDDGVKGGIEFQLIASGCSILETGCAGRTQNEIQPSLSSPFSLSNNLSVIPRFFRGTRAHKQTKTHIHTHVHKHTRTGTRAQAHTHTRTHAHTFTMRTSIPTLHPPSGAQPFRPIVQDRRTDGYTKRGK